MMMWDPTLAGRGVCLRCQFRLLVAAHTRARRGIATSASALRPHNAAATAQDESRLQNEGWVNANASEPPSSIPVMRPIPDGLPPRRASSLAMFQTIVERQANLPAALGGTAGLELVKDVAKIQTMLEKEGATLAEAFAYFQNSVYPQLKDSGSVPQIIKNQIAAVLLEPIALAKPRSFDSNELPSVARITEIMIELDVLRPSAWAALILELVQHVYRQKTIPEAYSSVRHFETAMALRDVLLRDLLGAWRAFCAQRTKTPESPAPKQAAKDTQNGKKSQSATLQKAFGAMFPQYLVPSLLKPSLAAFATYKLLTEPFNRPRSTKEDAAPFLDMMRTLIFQTRPPRREDYETVLNAYPDLPRFLWPRKPVKDASFLDATSAFGDKSRDTMAKIHRQLSEAVSSKNPNAVTRIWKQFWGEEATPSAERVTELAQHQELFDFFIYAYAGLRKPQLAIDVWNNMERIGIKPTIKTWSSMLQGFVKAGSLQGLLTVWNKLVHSGVKLDTAIWTTRIHGLFACGDPDGGLRALDEMANIWANRTDPQFANIAVQPTIEPVNAALAGLLRLNRPRSDINKLLTWASRKGINPDLYTFNTLLRPLVRAGDMAGIDEVLTAMRSINIQADGATWAVLLEGVLYQIGHLPPPQQVSLVERVLETMKASGVEVNMLLYAKIIHLLLREGDAAEEPVKAVLAHIWHRGLELTSHIYTMLANHYFSRDPPDCEAVAALIENRRLHQNRAIDRVFWERVVSGYAQAGEVARALEVFDRVLLAAGSTVTFSTLYDLLRPLIAMGDLRSAQRVVEAARKIGRVDDGGGTAGGGGGGGMAAHGKRYWRHRFWHLAYKHGLMGEGLEEKFLKANSEAGLEGVVGW